MLLVHPAQAIVRAAPALVGLLVAGTSSGHGSVWSLVGLAATVTLGLLRWFTTTFQITAEQVQVRRGILRRRVLAVPRDRVRSVDVTANVLHRVLGLARVTVGTGLSDRKGERGLRLDALTASQASQLRQDLLHRQDPQSRSPGAAGATEPAPLEVELARMSPAWFRYGPFTMTGIVTIGVLTAFISRLVSEAHIDLSQVGPLRYLLGEAARTAPALALLVAVPVCLALVAAASTIGYVLAFWQFRLTRHDDGTLRVERGLITTRSTTIEERRLRGIELSEPLLLRVMGGARCIAITTGLRVGRGAERGGTLLLPPAPLPEARRVAAEVLGKPDPVTCSLTSHGRWARRRRLSRALAPTGLTVAALAVLWLWFGLPAWPWQAGTLMLPLAMLVATDRYRSLGHSVVAGCLVSARGSVVRRRCVLTCEGIISWNLRQSIFQRRGDLVSLSATTAAGRQSYTVQDVGAGEALRVAEEAVPGLLAPFLVAPAGRR